MTDPGLQIRVGGGGRGGGVASAYLLLNKGLYIVTEKPQIGSYNKGMYVCLTNQGVNLENEDGDKAKIDVHHTTN